MLGSSLHSPLPLSPSCVGVREREGGSRHLGGLDGGWTSSLPRPQQPVLLGTAVPSAGVVGASKDLGVSADSLGGRQTSDAKSTLPTRCINVSLNLEGEAEPSLEY